MSTALASARKRRAPPQPVGASAPGTNQLGQPNQSANVGLTLPQVISLVDRRLITLETFMKESQTARPSETTKSVSFGDEGEIAYQGEIPSNLTEVLEEYNSRFDMLAEEIANLKNIVLNLQSYTMDVNKVLMQDRIRILTEEPAMQPVSSETLEEALAFE
jgi:hypothetical protein